MTETAAKYRLNIKTTGPRLLYPIINTFCSDSGMSFNDAKNKLTTTGAMLECTSKELADNAATKYKKLGCAVIEEAVEANGEEEEEEDARTWACANCGRANNLSLEKCECGYNLYQSSNEPSGASPDNKSADDSNEESSGFAGIGKRLDDLKAGGGTEDVKAWKQATEEPQPKKSETVKKEAPQKVYTAKPIRDSGSSSRFPFAKAFWGIIGLIIVVSIFSGNSNKKSSSYKSSTQPTRQYSSPASDDDLITVGQYRCTRYHHNRAQELQPSDYEKQSIESEQSSISSLKIQIETDYVDQYSQSSIDRHNMLIDDYNSRLQRARWSIDSYNNKVNTHNNYLMNNCSKAY